MPEATLADEEAWFAGLPTVVTAAGGLITDAQGRVLLVKPNYRDGWALPGGICEHREPPEVGCGRELTEELGLEIPVGRLLAVDWGLPHQEPAGPIMHFIFDGGQIDDGAPIVLQESELDAYRFTAPAELAGYLPPSGSRRIAGAIRAKASGTTIYVPYEAS